VQVPGEVTRIDALSPECTGECPLSTWQLGAAQADQRLMGPGSVVSALAVGNLRGSSPARFDLVAASDAEPRSGAANAGHVHVHFGGTSKLTDMGDVVILGAQGGDRAGAALAITKLDGDDAQDLIIGAPGAFQTRGAVYVLYGRASWPAEIDLSVPDTKMALLIGRNIGDRFGSSLAVGGVPDVGKFRVIVGAPGISVVYALGQGQFPGGGMQTVNANGVPGKADSGFGASVAQAGGVVAIGAPLEGAAYTLPEAQPLDPTKLVRHAGEGGGFGTRVAMARLDAGALPSLVVGAPAAGAIYVIDGETTRTLRALPARKLGTVIGRLARDVGDLLMLGAPGDAGAAYLVNGASLRAVPSMEIADDGQPAAAALAGEKQGDRFGSQMASGDFDGDGALDLAVGADGAKTIFIFRGPL
jgi:hypothetical protein